MFLEILLQGILLRDYSRIIIIIQIDIIILQGIIIRRGMIRWW